MVGQSANQAFAVLQALAGRYAGRAARLWAAPYQGYMRLTAARRHLAHLLMSRIGRAPHLDARAFVRDVEGLRTRELLARWAPEAPQGLETVLAKLGETAWTPGDYRRLVALLAHGGPAAETLRHSAALTGLFVETLEILPARLRGPAVSRWVGNPWEARIVREAVGLAESLGGEPRVDALVERLGRAKSRARFFAMLVDELRPNGLAAPVAETALLRPLRTVAEVRDAGRRFRNCLATCVQRAVFGDSAFVEWRGEEPAVMELEREGAAGWRLVVVLGVGNANVSAHTARLVREALEAQGVRTGWGAQFLLQEIDDIVDCEEREQAAQAVAVAAE
jgi:hypothetical protein